MLFRARHLFVLLCLILGGIALPLPTLCGQNVVEQRIVTGFGFWNDDNYSIHAHVSSRSTLPNGNYYLHFTEHNGVDSFDQPFTVANGQITVEVFDWTVFSY